MKTFNLDRMIQVTWSLIPDLPLSYVIILSKRFDILGSRSLHLQNKDDHWDGQLQNSILLATQNLNYEIFHNDTTQFSS